MSDTSSNGDRSDNIKPTPAYAARVFGERFEEASPLPTGSFQSHISMHNLKSLILSAIITPAPFSPASHPPSLPPPRLSSFMTCSLNFPAQSFVFFAHPIGRHFTNWIITAVTNDSISPAARSVPNPTRTSNMQRRRNQRVATRLR